MSQVSVVVPIYNAGKKLHKCIRSILDQTFPDFELILVNDGSKDNSLEICEAYHKHDGRIIVINKENKGSVAARKDGIQRSSSPYIMFVDADDWIDQHTIELLYNESIAHHLDITVCNAYKVLGNGMLVKRKTASWYFDNDKIYNEQEIKQDLVTAYLHGHPFPASLCAKLYKRELLLNAGRYIERIRFLGDDLFYNLEIFLKAKRVKIIKKPLYYYRLGGFTSKFMPYLFEDMVNGYEVQKEVIESYYQDSRDQQYYGISLMLLNTFQTCLHNLFKGKLNELEIREAIMNYTFNANVIECLSNEGAVSYFHSAFLNAIRNQDVDYLYRLGQRIYGRNRPREYVIHTLSKIL